MPTYDYIIERFHGLDQSLDECLTHPGCTHDAINVNTDGGRLTVCGGFGRIIQAPVPGEAPITRAFLFHSAAGDVPIAIAGGVVYAYSLSLGEWQQLLVSAREPDYGYYCLITAQIGTTDYLIIADGIGQMMKYDGTTVSAFGSAAGCSDIACSTAAMYRGRLFAAGDAQHPNRLYYSQLPGGDRSIEDWSCVEDSPSVEGGHAEIGTTGGDPITCIYPLTNMLVIFKKHSIYRLLGDRPGNFTVERVADLAPSTCPGAVAALGGVLYYLTSEGLHSFNGVDAAPMPDMKRIRDIMSAAAITSSRMAAVGERLYFTVSVSGETRLIEYSVSERRYLQYGGFTLGDVLCWGSYPVVIGSTRRLCRWGAGGSFDGAPINARWVTPLTDLGDRSTIKTLRELSLRGRGGLIDVTATVGGVSETHRVLLPGSPDEVAELPLKNEGRTLRLKLENVSGGGFTLCGGLQLTLGTRKRVG